MLSRKLKKPGLLLVIFFGVWGGRVVAENESGKASTELLVTVEGLQQLLGGEKAKDLILLDCRAGAEFRSGHLPGAQWVDVSRWKAAALQGNGAGLKDKQVWQRLGRALGISLDGRIVVYGGSLPSAARVWWLLKYIGCKRVSLLDGGISAWKLAGQRITQRAAEVTASEFVPNFQPQRIAGLEEVKRSAVGKGVVVFDTRSDGEFAAGRVPKSVHLEWTAMLTAEGRFKSREELRKLFKPSVLGTKKTAITYCRSGGRASVEAFALELAGHKNVKNYFCSWQQYSKDGTAAVEK